MIGIALAERIGASPVARRLAPLLARRKRHSRAQDAEDVRYHYECRTISTGSGSTAT